MAKLSANKLKKEIKKIPWDKVVSFIGLMWTILSPFLRKWGWICCLTLMVGCGIFWRAGIKNVLNPVAVASAVIGAGPSKVKVPGPAKVTHRGENVHIEPAATEENPNPEHLDLWASPASSVDVETSADGKTTTVRISRFNMCLKLVAGWMLCGDGIEPTAGIGLLNYKRLWLTPLATKNRVSAQLMTRWKNVAAGMGPSWKYSSLGVSPAIAGGLVVFLW